MVTLQVLRSWCACTTYVSPTKTHEAPPSLLKYKLAIFRLSDDTAWVGGMWLSPNEHVGPDPGKQECVKLVGEHENEGHATYSELQKYSNRDAFDRSSEINASWLGKCPMGSKQSVYSKFADDNHSICKAFWSHNPWPLWSGNKSNLIHVQPLGDVPISQTETVHRKAHSLLKQQCPGACVPLFE